MKFSRLGLLLVFGVLAFGQDSLAGRARRYLEDLVRIDTSNPPGNETRAAAYLKRVADEQGIPSELLGTSPARLNFVARLPGEGKARPLLLMAHTDVVPAVASQWSVAPFSGDLRGGFLWGRGAIDDKSLLAAELAVLVELKSSGRKPTRDVILLAEADEEDGSSGIQWLIRNAWPKIDAEFALNEGGFAMDLPSGTRVFQIQTTEKIPTPVVVRAHGTAGHGSLPRPDNAVVRLSRALISLAEADQPVRLNSTTRRYLTELARLPEYAWLAPLYARLSHKQTAVPAANAIRRRDLDLDAQLRTSVSPDVLHAGDVVNVIPARAEAQVDVRRLPDETRDEVIARLRRIVHNDQVEILPLPGHDMPATSPSSLSTQLYKAMETVLRQSQPKALVVPYMQRGATDGSFLRKKGMDVYGVPLFVQEPGENRAHGTDERIAPSAFDEGVRLLWQIVAAVTAR
jgi:acetylornithine deacetylase/succinyl-diaminopimelate desuccinylase-like protein